MDQLPALPLAVPLLAAAAITGAGPLLGHRRRVLDASTSRFTASWLTTTTVPPRLCRTMSARPAMARSRTADRGSTPGASSTEPNRSITDSRLVPVHCP